VPTPPSDEELLAGIALANAVGVGIRSYHIRVAECGSATAAFARHVPPAERAGLLEVARATLEAAAERGVTVLSAADDRYPPMLRTLRDAPPHLFALGSLDLLRLLAIAIVGTRSATPYGLRVTRRIATELARGGVAIVSGMARGIDAAAHEAALDAGGATIAVLGTGADVPYPRFNALLHARIARDGLVISELPCGTRAFEGSFPRRNRLIAALARTVVVTEAPEKSGALITASVANDIGRDVAVVPGSIESPACVGSNRLLRDGAAPILDLSDIKSLGGLPQETLPPPRAPQLSDDAQVLWRALAASGPLSADGLARAGGLDARRAAPALAALEIAGWIEVDHAGVVFPR
jgi:DNA processing protein